MISYAEKFWVGLVVVTAIWLGVCMYGNQRNPPIPPVICIQDNRVIYQGTTSVTRVNFGGPCKFQDQWARPWECDLCLEAK